MSKEERLPTCTTTERCVCEVQTARCTRRASTSPRWTFKLHVLPPSPHPRPMVACARRCWSPPRSPCRETGNMLQQRFLVWATPGCVDVRASAACLYPRGNAMARSVGPPHVDVATQNAMNASLACTSCVLPARTGTTLSLCRPLTPPPTTPSIGVRVRQLPNPPQAQS
jgi:hypothetical protein